MKYRKFGNTGVDISVLGFGAMRLPTCGEGEEWHVDEDKAIPMIHKAFDLGVNYIDTAHFYCKGESEIVVGKALKGYRDKVYLSTKIPTWDVKETSDYYRLLVEQLRKLDVDYIDFYHFHALNKKNFNDTVLKLKLIDEAEKAKSEGLIKHISFSFHDKAGVMKEIIDTGAFESVLCQYNLLDKSNEESIAYAARKGLGTVIMGPVGGGRLAYPSELFIDKIGESAKSSSELALRFVISNSNVSCALSGMGTIEMVRQNCEAASRDSKLADAERNSIDKMLAETKELANLYCTGCSYCIPCPKGIKIPDVFQTMIYHRVYKLTEYAREKYKEYGKLEHMGTSPEECVNCGKCLDKCPQKINIPVRLKEISRELSV